MSEQKNRWFDENVDPDVANAIIRIKAILPNNIEFERDFRPDVALDYDNLEKQMEEIPSMFAFWSSVLAEQRSVVAKLKRSEEAHRAFLAKKLIEENDGIPKWKIDELIQSDEKIVKLAAAVIVAQRTESKLYAIVDALRMKSDMLRSLAGFKKQELQDAGR